MFRFSLWAFFNIFLAILRGSLVTALRVDWLGLKQFPACMAGEIVISLMYCHHMLEELYRSSRVFQFQLSNPHFAVLGRAVHARWNKNLSDLFHDTVYFRACSKFMIFQPHLLKALRSQFSFSSASFYLVIHQFSGYADPMASTVVLFHKWKSKSTGYSHTSTQIWQTYCKGLEYWISKQVIRCERLINKEKWHDQIGTNRACSWLGIRSRVSIIFTPGKICLRYASSALLSCFPSHKASLSFPLPISKLSLVQ